MLEIVDNASIADSGESMLKWETVSRPKLTNQITDEPHLMFISCYRIVCASHCLQPRVFVVVVADLVLVAT